MASGGLKWTKAEGRGVWTASGNNGRRYEIEMRGGYTLWPTVAGMTQVKKATMVEAQEIAWGFEVAARTDDKLAKARR